jgi:hypothetical protein
MGLLEVLMSAQAVVVRAGPEVRAILQLVGLAAPRTVVTLQTVLSSVVG